MLLRRLLLASLVVLVVIHAAEKKRAKLIRQYGQRSTAVADLTADGRWLLTQGCVGTPFAPCKETRLSVFDTQTGALVDQLATQDSALRYEAGFFHGRTVEVALRTYRTGRQSRAFTWNPGAGRSSEFEIDNSTSLHCVEGEGRFLSVVPSGKNRRLAILDQAGVHPISAEFPTSFRIQCAHWRRANDFLVPIASTNKPPTQVLGWISATDETPVRICRSFALEKLYSHAVSPDGSLVAAITGTFDWERVPQHLVYLNLLAAEDCRVLKRAQLRFPKQARKNWNDAWTDVLFTDQLARNIAISPNNQLLAISYGMLERPNGQAYFGLYSISSGELLATLKGDSYKCNLAKAIFLITDQPVCESAPTGPIRFSPDSRTLFTSSEHIQQWDISALQ